MKSNVNHIVLHKFITAIIRWVIFFSFWMSFFCVFSWFQGIFFCWILWNANLFTHSFFQSHILLSWVELKEFFMHTANTLTRFVLFLFFFKSFILWTSQNRPPNMFHLLQLKLMMMTISIVYLLQMCLFIFFFFSRSKMVFFQFVSVFLDKIDVL